MNSETILLILALIPVILYLWSLVDILRNEFNGNNKIIWFLVVFFLNIFGAFLYLLFGRKQKISSKNSVSSLLIVLSSIAIIFIILYAVGFGIGTLIGGSDNESNQDVNQEYYESEKENQSSTEPIIENEKSLSEDIFVYSLDVITVNLAGSGKRYLTTEISLEFTGTSVGIELDSKKPLIRDEIINILSSKYFEEISSRKGKEKLSLEIIEVLNSTLESGKIDNLYFSEFKIL